MEFFHRTGGPRAIVLRYTNVYGPRQDPHGEAGVVAIFIQQMLKGQTPTIFGDGKQTRDFVYVKDVAEANLLAAHRDIDGIFNIGTGKETNVNTLASLLADATGYTGGFDYQPARPGEQLRSVVDPSKAKEVLGFSPRISIEEGLRQTVHYFKQKALEKCE